MSEFEMWMRMQSRREATIIYYCSYIKWTFRNGRIKWTEFGSREAVQNCFENIWKLDIKNSTRKKYLMSMRIFSDFLISKGFIDVNYARECLKCPKVQKALPFAMDRDCFTQVYNAIYRRWWDGMLGRRNKMIFDTLIYTGLRREELTKVLRTDVDEKKISVRDGKWWKKRNIYLPDHFSIELQEYLRETEGESEYLFFSDRIRWNKLWVWAISTTFKRIAEYAWMRIYPHLLRHTYASNCVIDGVDIYTVQQQLGHSDVSTTSIYLYLNDDQRLRNIQKLKYL